MLEFDGTLRLATIFPWVDFTRTIRCDRDCFVVIVTIFVCFSVGMVNFWGILIWKPVDEIAAVEVIVSALKPPAPNKAHRSGIIPEF